MKFSVDNKSPIFLIIATVLCLVLWFGRNNVAPAVDPSQLHQGTSSNSRNMTEFSLLERAQADFALDLLREVSSSSTNNSTSSSFSTVISPLSVLFPLAMAYAGARGQTAEEFQKILTGGKQGNFTESQVHEYFGELLTTIKNNEKNMESSHTLLAMANKVFVKSDFPLLDTLTATIEKYYRAEPENIESVDFTQRAKTAKKINQFVEQATRDKIHDLITPDMLDELTRLVLVNAVYFNGRWAKPFDPRSTRKRQFHVSEDNQKTVEMMYDDDDFFWFSTEDFKMLALPYVGEEVFMFVLLPNKRFGLCEMLAKLSGEQLLELFQRRSKSRLLVSLPKFKLEATHDLKESLMKLGLTTAFDSRADFSGISPTKDDGQLVISEVLQNAFIEVNEHGTEAAAATAVKFVLYSLPPQFTADHPFAFFLVDMGKRPEQHQNMILFSGIFGGD